MLQHAWCWYMLMHWWPYQTLCWDPHSQLRGRSRLTFVWEWGISIPFIGLSLCSRCLIAILDCFSLLFDSHFWLFFKPFSETHPGRVSKSLHSQAHLFRAFPSAFLDQRRDDIYIAPLWKWSIPVLPSGYFTVCHRKISIFKFGKPSISMGHFHPFSMAMLVITRG